MNSRRTIILLVAIVIGALASFGLLNYIRGVEDAADEGQQLVEVWVIRDNIPRGTPAQSVIDGGLIIQQSVPVEFSPATAIGEPASELAGLVAVTDLPANAVLVDGNFVSPSVVATGVTDRLKEKEMVTVTFSLDQVKAAAYLIEPGDFVNVLALIDTDSADAATDDVDEGSETPATGGDGSEDAVVYANAVRYLYQQAEVLAIDKSLTADLGQAEEDGVVAPNSGLITLAVPVDAVQRILGVGQEKIYLSLLPSNYNPQAIPPLDLEVEADLLPGENEDFLTPYGPNGLVEDVSESGLSSPTAEGEEGQSAGETTGGSEEDANGEAGQ